MAMTSYGSGSVGVPQAGESPPRPMTSLESHLDFLRNLNSKLYHALERATKCADRLLGPEPQPIRDAQNSAKPPAEPPLTRQIEEAAMQLAHLADGVHEQLGRIERV